MTQIQIWRVRSERGGGSRYFDNQPDAENFARSTTESGFTVRVTPMLLPKTAKDFVAFMERIEEER